MSYRLVNEDSQEQFASDVRSGLFETFNDKADVVAYYQGSVVGFLSAGSLNQAVEMGQNTLDQNPQTKGLSPDFAIEVTPEAVAEFKVKYPMSEESVDHARKQLEHATKPAKNQDSPAVSSADDRGYSLEAAPA